MSVHNSLMSTLPFEDGLAQLQVLAAAQGFGYALGLPQRALPPATRGTAGGETRAPPGPRPASPRNPPNPRPPPNPPPRAGGREEKKASPPRRSSRFPH